MHIIIHNTHTHIYIYITYIYKLYINYIYIYNVYNCAYIKIPARWYLHDFHVLRSLCTSLNGPGRTWPRSVRIGWAPKATMLCRCRHRPKLGFQLVTWADNTWSWIRMLLYLGFQAGACQPGPGHHQGPLQASQGAYSRQPLVDPLPTRDLQPHISFGRWRSFRSHGATLSKIRREDLCGCCVEPLCSRLAAF